MGKERAVITGSRVDQEARARCKIAVTGIVQGVGFRPFIHRLARKYDITGSVHNFTGGVVIEAEGRSEDVEAFVADLPREKPPIAKINSISVGELPLAGHSEFVITPSREASGGTILLSPDVATCADCLVELCDPNDRRWRYPFINCTNCGPRFTIIERVPYDRPNTTMRPFRMCPLCQGEYDDIDNRRYHAQPNACAVCGPRVELVCGDRRYLGDEAVQETLELLAGGKIIAIKSLGGFHLACDATNENAVQELRRRKGREEKPLAIMSADLADIASYCLVTDEARELLTGPIRPIVLLKKASSSIAPSVAPASKYYGVMTPYTPLHHLLLADQRLLAVVMTSGNRSEEPLATQNDEAQVRLAHIADGFLLHDRHIKIGCDDSVVRPTALGPIILRRARGYVPFPVTLQRDLGRVLAVGGHLKNTFCLTDGHNAFLSQHIGDLEDAQTLAYFEWCVEHLQDLLCVQPQLIAHDLHPDYLSTRYARRLAQESGLEALAVQHHHAHVAACMAENAVTGPVLGIACDGTGYGADGTVWGCEILVSNYDDYTRAAHLDYVPLPGGEQAIKEPWRMAAVYLHEQGLLAADIEFCRRLDRGRWRLLQQMIDKSINCPRASSAGRLFSAVSALLGLRWVEAYEGQSAIMLEAAATEAENTYSYDIVETNGVLIMSPGPMFPEIVADLRAGADVGEISARFHNTFIAMLGEVAVRLAAETGIRQVALSGGTFQNELVLMGLCQRLTTAGLDVLIHKETPPNDGGLALGQAVVASARKD